MQSSSQYTLSQNLTNQKIIHQDNTSNVSPTLPQPVNTCQTRIIQINRTISVPINSTKRPLPPIPSLKSPPVKLQSPVTKGPPPSISNSSVPKIRQHAATHSALPPVPPKPRKVTSERDFSVSRSDSQDNLSFSFVRSKAVLELVNTERAFLEDMNLMINKFLVPLRSNGLLSSGEIIKLFLNAEMVAAISKELLTAWEKCLTYPRLENSVLGEAFLSKFKEISSIYKAYCVGHKEALSIYEEKRKKGSFASFLEERTKDPELRRLSLLDFLIKPVQRVCKYPLLLEKLLETTSPTHPDYNPLKEALNAVNQFLDEVNTSAKEAEMLHTLMDIENRLTGLPEHLKLATQGRQFLFDGRWTKISGSHVQERHFFMFSDMLIYAKPSVLKKDYYEYKGMCPFHTCQFLDIPDSDEIKNAIGIVRQDSSKKKYVIYTKDPEQKQKWLSTLNQIANAVNNNNKNNNNSNNNNNNNNNNKVEDHHGKMGTFGTKEQLTMVQIEERVSGWKNDNSTRVYIDEGPVMLLKDGSTEPEKRYLFLFNDSLMITKKIKKVSTKTPFQFQKMLNLKSTLLQNIDSCEEGEYVFALVAMDTKEKFLVITSTPEEKVKWYNLIIARRNELSGDDEKPISISTVLLEGASKRNLDHKHSDIRQRAYTFSGISPLSPTQESGQTKENIKPPQFKKRMFSKVGYKINKDKEKKDKEKEDDEEDDSGEKREAVDGFEVPPWDDDSLYPACVSCKTKFTPTFRRHHCRNCGKVFCDNCTSKRCYLPRYGFTKKKVRVCDRCFLVH